MSISKEAGNALKPSYRDLYRFLPKFGIILVVLGFGIVLGHVKFVGNVPDACQLGWRWIMFVFLPTLYVLGGSVMIVWGVIAWHQNKEDMDETDYSDEEVMSEVKEQSPEKQKSHRGLDYTLNTNIEPEDGGEKNE